MNLVLEKQQQSFRIQFEEVVRDRNSLAVENGRLHQ